MKLPVHVRSGNPRCLIYSHKFDSDRIQCLHQGSQGLRLVRTATFPDMIVTVPTDRGLPRTALGPGLASLPCVNALLGGISD